MDLSHYRVDRMANVRLSSESITTSGLNKPSLIIRHKKQLFGMYIGEECNIIFEADNSLIDTVLDKFGFETHLFPCSESTFTFSAIVLLSPGFFGWCLSFSEKLKIVALDTVVNSMRCYLNNLVETYTTLLKIKMD